MAAPPTLVASIVTANKTGTQTSRTTPTFNVQAGDLILIYGYTGDGNFHLNTPTWTGPGAITLLRSVNIVERAGLYVWAVTATSTLSNVAISCTTADFDGYAWWITAHQYRNHGGIGDHASSNTGSGTVSISLPLPQANSAISLAINDYNAGNYGSRTYRAPGVNGAAMVEDAWAVAPPAYSGSLAHTVDTGGAGAEVAGISAPTAAWTGIAVEVRAATGSLAGVAGLSGVGSLGASGSATVRTGALSGAGTLAGTGIRTLTAGGTSSLSGVGALAGVASSVAISRVVMLGGIGSLSGRGSRATLEQYVYKPKPPRDTSHRVQWRYIAQRLLTGEIVSWELPLTTDGPQWDLSGPGSLRGTIKPERVELVDVDGTPLLQEWGTAIYAEADGQIRWGGIIRTTGFSGAEVTIEAAGFSSYAAGMPYTGPYWAKVQHDPTLAFVSIWTHLQTQPDGNLGLEFITPPDCPVRIGAAAIPGYTTYKAGDGKFYKLEDMPAGSRVTKMATSSLAVAMTAASLTLTLTKLDTFDQVPLPATIEIGNEHVRLTARSGLKLTVSRGWDQTDITAHAKGVAVKFLNGTEVELVETVPAEPYVLAWWDAIDCGSELDKLAQETPFDYSEEHYWDGNTIRHRIRVDYPRLGVKRTSLAFVQGENVTGIVTATLNGDDFANHVYGIGAGEGALSIRTEIATRDSRLRRAVVYTDKTATTTARLSSISRNEFIRRRLLPEVTSLEVVDHPNARIGAWNIGDDILIRYELPVLGYREDWHRITSWALNGENRATLTVARSDSFNYGYAVPPVTDS